MLNVEPIWVQGRKYIFKPSFENYLNSKWGVMVFFNVMYQETRWYTSRNIKIVCQGCTLIDLGITLL